MAFVYYLKCAVYCLWARASVVRYKNRDGKMWQHPASAVTAEKMHRRMREKKGGSSFSAKEFLEKDLEGKYSHSSNSTVALSSVRSIMSLEGDRVL